MDQNDGTIRPAAEITLAQSDFRDVVLPRPPNEWERRLLERLLVESGRQRLLDQLAEVRVAAECSHCPSIELAVGERIPSEPDTSHGWRHAAGEHELVSELEARDADGMGIWALLFTQDGYLVEMEVQRWDGEPVMERPAPETFGPPATRDA